MGERISRKDELFNPREMFEHKSRKGKTPEEVE
jgi:hypothetical protein